MLIPWKKNYDQPRHHINKQRHYLANKSPSSQGYDFSSSHVWMWQLDYRESWALKNWCFWTVVLEKTLESPLDSKIKPVNPKGNQSCMFIGKTDAEAETSILWLPHAKNWLIVKKNPDAGKDWRQEEEGMTEDKIVGWHHRLDGHEFEQIPGAGDEQGSLACCSPWGCKELDILRDWTDLPWAPQQPAQLIPPLIISISSMLALKLYQVYDAWLVKVFRGACILLFPQ